MEEENTQTPAANPGEEAPTNVASPEGAQNGGSNPTTTPALSLEEINSLTGHKYSNLDDAKKGLVNLKSAVGKKEIPVDNPALVKQVKTLEFFLEHPEYKDAKSLITKFGDDPNEVIKDPVFQQAYKGIQAVVETEKQKTTITSTSRVATPPSDEAQKAFKAAQDSGLPEDWGSVIMQRSGLDIKE